MNSALNINTYNILVIIASAQGLFFSLMILLSKKYKSTSNHYIGKVVLYLSLNNLYYWLLDTNLVKNIPIYQYLYIPWNLLIVSTFYLFVQSYLNRIGKKNWYLILPFFSSLTIHIFILIQFLIFNGSFEIEEYIAFYYFEEYFSALYTVLVIYKTFNFIKNYQKQNTDYKKNKIAINTKWLKQVLFFGVFICFIWLFLTALNHFVSAPFFNDFGKYFLWISMSVLIYFIAYLSIYHNGVFNQRQEIREKNNSTKKIAYEYTTNNKFEEIKKIIDGEKLFLNPNLNIGLLSEKLELNESYFSHLFNKNSNENFSSFVNKKRIREAKKLLTNKEFSNYTIISIGLESGFNSKSAFYNVFKKETGLTPTQFRKQNLS